MPLFGYNIFSFLQLQQILSPGVGDRRPAPLRFSIDTRKKAGTARSTEDSTRRREFPRPGGIDQLPLWEDNVLIVRDFSSTLVCHDQSRQYCKQCVS